MKKFLLVVLAVALSFFAVVPRPTAAAPKDLRFAITGAVASDPSYQNYRELTAYIAQRVRRKAVFISGLTYSQVDRLFVEGQVDVGFLSNCHYVRREGVVKFDTIAAPVIEGYGKPEFRVYVVVRKGSRIASLDDLRGKTVDLADPLSTTNLYAAYLLQKRHETIKSFFGKAIYSGSHDMTVRLVATGMVDAGFIDGDIWDFDQKVQAQYSSKTKVIARSEEFTIPPVVVRGTMSGKLRRRLTEAFLDMHRHPRGREILRKLRIEKFVKIRDRDYQDVRRMYDTVKGSL